MAEAKKRGLWLIGTLLLIAVAAGAVTGSFIAYGAAIPLAITFAIQLAAPIDDDPAVPNNPAKLPLFAAGLACGLVLATWGIATERWLMAAIGAGLVAISGPCIRVIRQGRNPWWLRAWADYWRR